MDEAEQRLYIDLALIERATGVLLEEVASATGRASIPISKDLYWEVSSDQLYDPLRSPRDLTLGSLAHDLERIAQLVNDPRLAVPNALRWLGSVLSALGDSIIDDPRIARHR